jgi:polyphosphate glucokinase
MVPIHEHVLAIDIGATSTKSAVVLASGEIDGEMVVQPTPYPCTPEVLAHFVSSLIEASPCHFVGVGFPGEVIGEQIIEPGNLSRSGGITTDIDPATDALWRGFYFEKRLRELTGREVKVVNDATLAALGCSVGTGRELVFTLGTGLGIALVVDAERVQIRDIGAEDFEHLGTYDEVFGEPARAANQALWTERLQRAVRAFIEEFTPSVVHLGGGNARFLSPELFGDLPVKILLSSNDVTMRGAQKLFDHN